MAAESKTKYDRQLRIWGEQGQAALEKASICLLNCGPTGSEALKNLVLGGIGSITVVDGSKVEAYDLGNNFMLDEESLGQSKAKCVCSFLKELNDAVKAKFVEESPDTLIETNPSFFAQFTLVIATQLLENSLLKLDKICRQANVILVVARSYGLTGLVRISLKEHNVIESKPDHFLDDLRLHNPWPELKQFAKTIDLSVTDPVVHKHTPYIVILVRLAEKWADAHDGCLPSTRQEKKEFKMKIIIKKLLKPHLKSPLLEELEFIENEGDGEPPLEGSIPDMTSLTEYYVSLQKIYQAKAESDCLVMEQRVRNILKRIGRDPDAITKAYIKNFCRNARKITVCRYRNIEDEFNTPNLPELQKYLTEEDYNFAVGFYILLRAVDRFAANYNRFPGIFDGEVDEDISRLKTIAVGLLSDLGFHGPVLSEDLINEMCRFGGAELHAVAAFIGGVASQEVIKLVTEQFVPLTGTFVFNGIDQKSQALAL
uniref:NEDD8-activating enzyme E1 regulatory subunit n=1 Tax=Elaeis guineensis var. tenera TaxID=51953 RepID=A0A8N4I996_ELAGV|nr:NEDD8-activating enzyme E1 regulatory subunit AXR1 isoform X2 [Elaeis guineensis]